MNKIQSIMLAGVAAGLMAKDATAGTPHCGYGPATWSAPNGALVLYQGPGPIKDVLSAVGETLYSHSMLSHGSIGWVSHATMSMPGLNSFPALCSMPIDPTVLTTGAPGAEQVSQAAIYTFLNAPGPSSPYFDRDGYLHTSLDFQFGNHTTGAAIANGLWNSLPYTTQVSDQNSGQYFYELIRNGQRMPYSFYQYKNIEGDYLPSGISYRNGVTCASFLAWAHAYFGAGIVAPAVYNHQQVHDAANALFNGVVGSCSAGGGDWATGLVALTGSCAVFQPWDPFPNLCGRLGNQVVNCMGTGTCNDTSPNWTNIANNPNETATSISPEVLGGWEGHPIFGTAWSSDIANPVTWSSPGNVYGCWE